MLLDQQYPMEHAFRGPAKILDRFGTLDPAAIAAADPEEFATMASTPPAIHRYGRSMAGRVQALAGIVTDTYGGHAERLWTEATSGADLLARVMALPGFGKQKAQIFTALLAKRLDVRPEGWEQAVGDYAQDGYRSVADVTDPASLQKVRDFKKAKKAAATRRVGLTLRRSTSHASRVRRESARALSRVHDVPRAVVVARPEVRVGLQRDHGGGVAEDRLDLLTEAPEMAAWRSRQGLHLASARNSD